MSEFFAAALAFPAVLFSFALVVVVVYWLVVLVGAAEVDALDGGEGVSSDGSSTGFAGAFAALRLHGVPVTVVLSLLIAIAWFVSLAGAALFDSLLLRVLVLPVALFASWSSTWALIRPLRHLSHGEVGVSRSDFVGRVCIVRTSWVDSRFGQAEVAGDDGSTAIIQVRHEGGVGIDAADGLVAGSTALIFDYDDEGEFFRVAPFDAALDPNRPPG
ncbi:DUF1449 domain-containing protein [Streptomyces sp. XM4193]|uniref:DUF1449 domain-containing protein n=1 Tax=Streptomyces sp. XM4193 TaxID=2929782 RepID=UPI001FF86F49|nr:DUF1449 domain-containing protein [Streptomyces sp. XM4193]MCK1798618.1 DUF1449 domain-containing protein [Streptomyces sp. XM4193]